jgi:preprotein translocase subunit YajC
MHNIIAMAPQGGSGGGGSFLSTLVMFSLIILIFYFMILRPQQKRQKDRQKLLDSVQKGDKVVTIGGAHGTVVGLDEKMALIEIADGVKVKYDRSAISSVNRSEDTVGKTKP